MLKNKRKPKLIIKKSPINGTGVFANRNFGPHKEVLNWSGSLAKVVYINHSCSPSCYTIEPCRDGFGQDILMAGPKGIKKGEEITFDYRKTRWIKLWRRTIKGGCGCSHCPVRRTKP